MIQENKPDLREIAIRSLDMKLLKKVNQIKTIINQYIENNDNNKDDEKFIEILAYIGFAASGVNNFIYIHEDMSYISLLAGKLNILYNKTINAKRHFITDIHKEIYAQIESILDLHLYNTNKNIVTQAKDKLDEIFNKIVEEIIEIIEEDKSYYDMHGVWMAAMNIKNHLQEYRAFDWYGRWDTLGNCINVLSKKCIEDKDEDIIKISNQISNLYVPDYQILIDNVINDNCPLLLAIADTNI